MPLPQNQVSFCLQSNVVHVTDFAFKCFLSYVFFFAFYTSPGTSFYGIADYFLMHHKVCKKNMCRELEEESNKL